MSVVHRNLCALFTSSFGSTLHTPPATLLFTTHGAFASHAAQHGLSLHSSVVQTAIHETAAAFQDTAAALQQTATAMQGQASAVATTAAATAAAAGTAALSAAIHQEGWLLSVRAAFSALFLAVAALWSAVTAAVNSMHLLATSLPRTLRTARWVLRAAMSYKKFAALHIGEDPESDAYQDALSVLHQHWAAQLLALCKSNGGVYIKAGQFAAAFGAVPREFRAALAGLEDRAVPRPYSAVQAVLLRELGPKAMCLFSEFAEEATAAASLAQVHRARLATGQLVAVKVQYPGLAGSVAADLAVLHTFNSLARVLFPTYRLTWLVEELQKKLAEELDFRTELQHAVRVSALLQKSKLAKVPRMHQELCTSRLLVMEWVDGCKVNDREAMLQRRINPRAVGLQLVRMFAHLTFVHGYMHGDPHAGNIMVREAGHRSLWSWLFRGSRQPFELVLLDHGTYLEVNDELRQLFCQLWCSFVLQDTALQADLSTAVAGERGPVVLPVLLTHSARSRMEERALQQAAGIAGVGDMAALLQAAPRPVVELLRINTVIRAIANQLGISMEERRRILACYARKGLPKLGTAGRHVHWRFNQALCRVHLMTVLGVWRGASAVKDGLLRGWSLVLGLWADVIE